MPPDPRRRPGFYWVRFEGAPIVAEYVLPDARERTFEANNVKIPFHCSIDVAHWHIPGCDTCFADKEVCELLTSQLRLGVPGGYRLPIRNKPDTVPVPRKVTGPRTSPGQGIKRPRR